MKNKKNYPPPILIFTVVFTLSFSFHLIAFDWTPYIDTEPCSFDMQSNVPWSEEPREKKICLTENCDRCCFTIIYYDRWSGINSDLYEVFIAGIFNDGSQCCEEYNQEEILEAFFNDLYSEKSENDAQFYNQVTDNGNKQPPYLGLRTIKGKCKEGETTCSTVCCTMPIEITFGGEGFQYYQVSNIMMGPAQYTSPECSLPCIQSCIVEKQGVEPVKCPIPCNYGEWSEVQEQTINVYNCPGCQITVRFQRRGTAPCPPENYSFYDYRLLGWSRNIQACINCLQWEEFYYSYAVNWLLRDGGLPKPTVVDECFTNYRVMSSTCWRFVQRNGQYIAEPCETEKCCYKLFRICKTGENPDRWTTTELENNYPIEQCEQPCIRICNIVPY